MSNYVITSGPDGTLWVSLQPLLDDINDQMANPEVMSNQLVADSLFAVRAFIAALVDEGQMDKLRSQIDESLR
jgi:hypothetical protein